MEIVLVIGLGLAAGWAWLWDEFILALVFLALGAGVFILTPEKKDAVQNSWRAVESTIERPEFVTPASVERRVKALETYCTQDAAKDSRAQVRVLAMSRFFARAYQPGEREPVLGRQAVQEVLALCAQKVGAEVPAS